MSRLHSALPSFAIAAAVLLALAGCAPQPAAAPTPAPTSTPTPTPTPARVVAVPATVLGRDCPDLLDASAAAQITGGDVSLLDEPAAAELPVRAGSLSEYNVVQLGGLSCEWSNGETRYVKQSTNPAYSGLTITMLPGAEEQWPRFRDYYTVVDDQQIGCVGSAEGLPTPECRLNALLVDDVWVRIEAIGAGVTEQRTTALAESLRQQLGAATRTELAWAPPADAEPVTGDCEQLLTAAQVRDAVGAPELFAQQPHGGWSQMASTWLMLDAIPCSFNAATSDFGYGGIDWLPGGEWAWEQAAPEGETIELADPVGTDAAVTQCDETGCTVHVLVASNWVQLQLYAGDTPAPTTPLAEAAPVLAQQIVDNVRG